MADILHPPVGNTAGGKPYTEVGATQLGISEGSTSLSAASSILYPRIPWAAAGFTEGYAILKYQVTAGSASLSVGVRPYTAGADLASPMLNTIIGAQYSTPIIPALALGVGFGALTFIWNRGMVPGNYYHDNVGVFTANSLNLNPIFQGPWAYLDIVFTNAGPNPIIFEKSIVGLRG